MRSSDLPHARIDRREALQAGAIGLLGVSMADLFRAEAAVPSARRSRSVIYIF